MFPAPTSFIPVQIALARFLENQGWQAIASNYPYWYLGTTPWRYLTGPILPFLLTASHRVLPFLNLFEIFFFWLILFWLLGIAGVYWLVKVFKGRGESFSAFLAAIFYGFGPLIPFWLRFTDGLSIISFSVLPFVLVSYCQWLLAEENSRKQKRKRNCFFLMVFLLLLDISALTPLFLGVTAVFLTTAGWKKTEKRLKDTFGLFFWSLLVATFWYSPSYWWQILKAPSLAGKSLLNIINLIGQLLPVTLGVSLALISGRFIKSKNRLLKFTFYWGFIFLFLTLLRFISDPDFWLDWSAYYLEIQLALGLSLAVLVSRFKLKLRKILGLFLVLVWFGVWGLISQTCVRQAFRADLTDSVEYRIGRWLNDNLKEGETVFLSGSGVFWLNAFFDVSQVRGGNDGPSVHPDWREAAWEIREGNNPDKSIKWLKKLEIDYLVIHSQESSEFYHDFKYPNKFEKATGLKRVYSQKGDQIYKLNRFN